VHIKVTVYRTVPNLVESRGFFMLLYKYNDFITASS